MAFIRGFGLLRHSFTSQSEDYLAAIGIQFDSPENATLALNILRRKGDGWSLASTGNRTLVWFGNSDQLFSCVKLLAFYGANPDAITSVSKDLKFGSDFEVCFEVNRYISN